MSASTLAGMRLVIDARLRLLLPLPYDADDRVGIAMHEGVLAPGKRIRPLLMLLVGRGVGSETKALIDLACAVEMVHAASLLVDDLGEPQTPASHFVEELTDFTGGPFFDCGAARGAAEGLLDELICAGHFTGDVGE